MSRAIRALSAALALLASVIALATHPCAAPHAAAPAADQFEDAKAGLASSDGRKRREAVAQLAALGGEPAWRLVLGALADGDPQVADQAQLELARLEPAPLAKLVAGKEGLESKSALVRERVVESFGRLGARPAGELLVAPLDDREPNVRRTAAWSIERLARAGRFEGAWESDMIDMSALAAGLVSRAAREKHAETRAAMHVAHHVLLGSPKRDMLAALLESRTPAERAAAAIVLRGVAGEESLASLARLAQDTDLGVRLNCARSFAALATREAALELVAMLEREGSARARWLLAEHLRALSGLRHRTDARPWRAWAEALPPGAIAAPASAARADEAAATSAFAGLPVLSERVTFVIDLSGSMWDTRADGRTRKALVDDELARALASLPAACKFNVIAYTSKPVAWKDELTPATPKNVASALEFFAKRKERGKGDLWAALEFALLDGEVDTLIVLSDGAPSGGERWNLELIGPLFAERTRYRGVVLEAVLADASKRIRDYWSAMCEASGGSVVELSLK